jgi:hypothetical protein
MTVDCDLRQEHVRVTRTTGVEQFLPDIRMSRLDRPKPKTWPRCLRRQRGWRSQHSLARHYNDAQGVRDHRRPEESSHSVVEGRKQHNWAKGYAVLEMTVHVSGGPKVTDPSYGKHDWKTLFNSFDTAYSEAVDGKVELTLWSCRMFSRVYAYWRGCEYQKASGVR